MTIKQGDIYWFELEQRIQHPYVVFQVNSETVRACKITTNRKKMNMPGNVVLEVGEGNLEKLSIVDVADVVEVKTFELGEFIGTLDESRVEQIFNGMGFIKRSFLKSEGVR